MKRVVQGYSRDAWLADFIFWETWISKIILRDSWSEGFVWPVKNPSFFYRYSWFCYSIPHGFETQVLRMVTDVYRERLVCDLQYGAIRYDLATRDSAFFKHCFYCKNRSLRRVFYLLIFVNRENEIVMPGAANEQIKQKIFWGVFLGSM